MWFSEYLDSINILFSNYLNLFKCTFCLLQSMVNYGVNKENSNFNFSISQQAEFMNLKNNQRGIINTENIIIYRKISIMLKWKFHSRYATGVWFYRNYFDLIFTGIRNCYANNWN